MDEALLSAAAAARRLGISRANLYAWLAQSNAGIFRLRGQTVSISYFQGGAEGRGRIWIELQEIERLRELMRVCPRPARKNSPPVQDTRFPGITVKLGRPRA